MGSSEVTLSSVELTLLGLTWGGEDISPLGPRLMSEEYDLSKYVRCRRDNY